MFSIDDHMEKVGQYRRHFINVQNEERRCLKLGIQLGPATQSSMNYWKFLS